MTLPDTAAPSDGPFVGRSAEHAALVRMAEGAFRAGTARIVPLVGPPGAGKWRLCDEAARTLAAGHPAFRAYRLPLPRPAPAAPEGPLAALVRARFGLGPADRAAAQAAIAAQLVSLVGRDRLDTAAAQLARLLEPGADLADPAYPRAISALANLLRHDAERGPLLLAASLPDAPAGAAAGELQRSLDRLLLRLGDRPVVLVTFSAAPPPPFGESGVNAARPLVLGPLAPADATALLVSALPPGLRLPEPRLQALVRLAGGLPGRLLAFAAPPAGAAPPVPLSGPVAAELSEDGRRCVTYAALVGPTVWAGLLAALWQAESPLPPLADWLHPKRPRLIDTTVQKLVRLGVFARERAADLAGEPAFALADPVLGEELRVAVASDVARRLRGAAADWLAARAGGARAPVVAAWLTAAERPEAATRFWLVAARQALRVGTLPAAAEALRTAESLGCGGSPGLSAEAHDLAIALHWREGNPRAAAAACAAALALARQRGDGRRTLRALVALARCLAVRGDLNGADDALGIADTLGDAPGAPATRATVATLQGRLALLRGGPDAVARARAAAAAAEQAARAAESRDAFVEAAALAALSALAAGDGAAASASLAAALAVTPCGPEAAAWRALVAAACALAAGAVHAASGPLVGAAAAADQAHSAGLRLRVQLLRLRAAAISGPDPAIGAELATLVAAAQALEAPLILAAAERAQIRFALLTGELATAAQRSLAHLRAARVAAPPAGLARALRLRARVLIAGGPGEPGEHPAVLADEAAARFREAGDRRNLAEALRLVAAAATAEAARPLIAEAEAIEAGLVAALPPLWPTVAGRPAVAGTRVTAVLPETGPLLPR